MKSYRWTLLCLVAACMAPPGAYGSQPAGSYGPRPGDGDDESYAGGDAGSSGDAHRWRCTAEGSVGTARGDGPWSYRTDRMHGSGPTRDDAYLKAFEDCHTLVRASLTLAHGAGERTDGGSCTVSDCIGPGGDAVTRRSHAALAQP